VPGIDAPVAKLGERVLRTLELADSRGYNLTFESLSALLVGGPAQVPELRECVQALEGADTDGDLVGLRGRLRTRKCARRRAANGRWGQYALSIAREYAAELARVCPNVRCVMLAGSAGSGGFCDRDDIDLNIVVRDGTKYTSYLTALLLSLKFSLRYGGRVGSRFLPGLKKVICVNVVWEERQVSPFARRDERLAFELLNSRVIYNEGFHRKMLERNAWAADLFPQLFTRGGGADPLPVPGAAGRAASPSPAVEGFSRSFLFALYYFIWGLRGGQPRLRRRMRFVEEVKRPYGIFDVPPGGARERAG
jgi:predicted nucleotidyltransferase